MIDTLKKKLKVLHEEWILGRGRWLAHEKDDGTLNRKCGKGNRNGKIGDTLEVDSAGLPDSWAPKKEGNGWIYQWLFVLERFKIGGI